MFFLQMFCMLGGTMREEMIWSSCWSLRVAMDCMRAQVILLKSSLYYIFYCTVLNFTTRWKSPKVR